MKNSRVPIQSSFKINNYSHFSSSSFFVCLQRTWIFVNVVNCLCVKTIYTEFLKIFYFIIISLSSLSSLLILILFLSLIYNNTYFINNKYLEIPFYLTNSLTINIFQRFINFIKLDPTMYL